MVFADVSVRATIRRMLERAEWQLADVVVRAGIKRGLAETEVQEERSGSSLVILTANENLERLLATLDEYAAAIAARGAMWLEPGNSAQQVSPPAQGNAPSLSTAEARDAEPAPLLDPLTPRQLDILRLLASGRTNREIAEDLTLSPGTVRTHVQRIIAKLDARDRTSAVGRAMQLGIIGPYPED